jgi:ankyrin repeat protein
VYNKFRTVDYWLLILNKPLRCEEILDLFKTLQEDFTGNPLHLLMISDTEGVESLQTQNVINLYDDFIYKKIKHGLLSCRQMQESSYNFQGHLKSIYTILTNCAVAIIVGPADSIFSLAAEDEVYINLSGVATVVHKCPLTFVHWTFAEFLTARHFTEMCFGPLSDSIEVNMTQVQFDVCRLFERGVSEQTFRFMDDFCGQNKDKKIDAGVLGRIKEMEKEAFVHICHGGMLNMYTRLFGEVFDGDKVRVWLQESHTTSKNGMSLYFQACRSSPQLATLLSEWCPMLKIDKVDELVEGLAIGHTILSRQCIEQALSSVDDWKSTWPRANFFDNFLDHSFSTDFYEFVLENCPDLDNDGLLKKIYSEKKCCKELLPIILHLGADLNCEKYGTRLAHIIFRDWYFSGENALLNFAIDVAKHFQVTKHVDSEESLLLIKNIGAKSPDELQLDCSSNKGRALYLKHVVECACALLDTGKCKPSIFIHTMERHTFHLKRIINIPELRPIATTFKLHLMRGYGLCHEQRALTLFHEVQQWIRRDFTYSCGCSLVHGTVLKDNLPLLEALDQHGFELNIANKKGETPLHWSVSTSYLRASTAFLLQRLLREFYVPRDAKREDIAARTLEVQRDIEDIIGVLDEKGRTPLLIAALKDESFIVTELLICNLLGPLVYLRDEEELLSRADSEQEEVERILTAGDSYGLSPLHYVVSTDVDRSVYFLQFMLKNLLGKYFISGKTRPVKRTLEQHQHFARLLHPKNNMGVTPLLLCSNHYTMRSSLSNTYLHRLLLMNLLGEYFVDENETSAKPLEARTDEENQFVRAVMFDEDDMGYCPYRVAIQKDSFGQEYLMYEANGRYLHEL